MSDQATFKIDVPFEKIPELQQALSDLNIPFHPARSMFYTSSESIVYGVGTGPEAQNMVDAINAHLHQIGLTLSIDQLFEDMKPPTRQHFLELAVFSAVWEGDFNPKIVEIDHQAVEDFISKHNH